MLSMHSAHAAQWYVEPSAILRVYHDDNVRLSDVEPISSFVTTATAGLESGRRSETSELGMKARVFSYRYEDASDLDKTDGSLDLLGRYRIGRSQFALDGAFNYDSTLTSEESTSGYVQVNKRRERLSLKPSWTYTLSPRAQLETTLSHDEVSYEDVDLIPLFDYSFSTLGLTLIYSLTERTQAFGRVAYDRYDATKIDTQSDNYGVEMGASYLWSETLTLSALAGVRQSKAETPTFFGIEETENTGPLFEIKMTKRFQVGQLNLTADRAMLPSSSGTLLDTTSLRAGFDYPLGPRLTFSLTANAYRNRSPDGEVSRYDRDYLSLSPKLEHRLSESLVLDLSYRYRWQEYDARPDDAVSNAIYLGLQYTPAKEPVRKWSVFN